MVKYNISPDALVDSAGEDVFEVPEVVHHFRKNPPGLLQDRSIQLIASRQAAKMEAAKSHGNPRAPDYPEAR